MGLAFGKSNSSSHPHPAEREGKGINTARIVLAANQSRIAGRGGGVRGRGFRYLLITPVALTADGGSWKGCYSWKLGDSVLARERLDSCTRKGL